MFHQLQERKKKIIKLCFLICHQSFSTLFGYSSFRHNSHKHVTEKREKKDKYTINVFLCLCYWVFKFKKKFHVYGNVIKKIKRWQCVFCYVCFFKLCCNYICRMPNKHCNMYHPCRRVFIFSVLIVIIFTLSSPLNLHSRHIYTKTDIR